MIGVATQALDKLQPSPSDIRWRYLDRARCEVFVIDHQDLQAQLVIRGIGSDHPRFGREMIAFVPSLSMERTISG